MTIAASVRPSQNLAALNEAYGKAVARKRRRSVLAAALGMAARGADVDLHVLFAKIGNFGSYFDRSLTLDTGARVWSSPGDWFWDLHHWLSLLGQCAR
jgi:phosphonate transport system permease protein